MMSDPKHPGWAQLSELEKKQQNELRLIDFDAQMLGVYAYERHGNGFIERIEPREIHYTDGKFVLYTPDGPELMVDVGPKFCSALALVKV